MKLRGVLDDPALEGWIIQPLPQNVEEIVVTVVLAPGGANTTVVELSALAEDCHLVAVAAGSHAAPAPVVRLGAVIKPEHAGFAFAAAK